MPREGLFPPGLFGGLTDYFADAAPGGVLNAEWTPEAQAMAWDQAQNFAPVWGGIKGAREEWEAGNPGWAAFNAATVPLDIFTGGLGGAAAKGLMAAAPFAGIPWFLKRMAGAPEKAAPAAATAKRVAGGEAATLRGSSKAPSIEDAMKYAAENNLTLRTANDILGKQWFAREVAKLSNMNYNPRRVAPAERFPPAPDDVVEAPRGLLGDAFKKQRGRIGDFDPRYANPVGESNPRVKDIERIRNLEFGVEGSGASPSAISLADLEGRPFITSMSDRTRAGGQIASVKGKELNQPVGLLGGQDYMFLNPGQVWASGKKPVGDILDLASQMKKQTGQDPLYMPWRMAPTGGDFAHMTGETMLSYADVGMNKRNKAKANTAIKKIIPGWKGIGDPAGIDQFRSLPDVKRKQVKDVLDKRFRDLGGLSVGEARMAVSDPSQIAAREGGLMNVGQIFGGPPTTNTGHPTYPFGVPGEGLGRLKEDVTAYQLLPGLAAARNVQNPAVPHFTDIRSMQMKPYAGIITPEILKSLGL